MWKKVCVRIQWTKTHSFKRKKSFEEHQKCSQNPNHNEIIQIMAKNYLSIIDLIRYTNKEVISMKEEKVFWINYFMKEKNTSLGYFRLIKLRIFSLKNQKTKHKKMLRRRSVFVSYSPSKYTFLVFTHTQFNV